MYRGKKYSLSFIKALMAKIAAKYGIPEQVKNTWIHSKAVYDFADKIARAAIKNNHQIDRQFIKVACFIHDIGRMVTGSKGSKVLKDAIYHGLEGYRLLKKYNYPEKLARVCLNHLAGSGVDKITNRQFGLFKNKDTLTRTIEEKIVAYADARTDYDKKKGKVAIISFKKAYQRFNKYPRCGYRLKQNHSFINKITKGQIK